MQITAKLNNLRIAPRKVRMIADLIRGKRVNQAQSALSFVLKKAARPVQKLLNSAVDSAEKNHQLEKSNLYISEIKVDEAPKLKRWRAESRGQPARILKRKSHITIVLDEINKRSKKKKKRKPEVKNKEDKEEDKREKKKLTKKERKFKPEREIKKPKKTIVQDKKFRRKAF